MSKSRIVSSNLNQNLAGGIFWGQDMLEKISKPLGNEGPHKNARNFSIFQVVSEQL